MKKIKKPGDMFNAHKEKVIKKASEKVIKKGAVKLAIKGLV